MRDLMGRASGAGRRIRSDFRHHSLYLYDMSQLVAVRLPDQLAARLNALSASTRRPKATYIREALEHELTRVEWEQGILQLREDVRAGVEETYSTDEVRDCLGLDG